MTKEHGKPTALLLKSILLVFCFASSGLAQSTGSAVQAPPSYYSFAPPLRGHSYVDPVFGSTIERISDATATMNAANGSGLVPFISDEYSTMSPFNSDNFRILGLHLSYFGLYDGSGGFIKNLITVCASCSPRWSRTNPSVLYYVSGNQLRQLDVSTNVMAVLHTFTEYAEITGKGESDISADGDHFVFAGDDTSVFVYELSTDSKGPVFHTGGRGYDSLYITPRNSITITWYAHGTVRYTGIELFDRNMNFQRQVADAGGHMDVASDVNGDEILLWANSADPSPICPNAVVKIRLADAQQTCLISLDWSLAIHVSAADAGGSFFMETYAPGDPDPSSAAWKPYTNEILQVKLDGSEVRRLAHHRSRPFDSYNYTPRASASRDGSRLVFNSNYGLFGPSTIYTDLYLMVLSPSSPVTVSIPVPVPAPIPTPSPISVPLPTSVNTNTSSMQVGYGMIDAGTGTAVLRSFSGTNLVSEAAVPGTATAMQWLMYAEKGEGVSTGVAVANPNSVPANLTLMMNYGTQTTLTVPANGHFDGFINELFSNLPQVFLGTLTIQSDVPVAVLAMRETLNAAGEFIIAAIPLSSSAPISGGTEIFPIIVDGGGYNSELILVNSGSSASMGTIQFSIAVAHAPVEFNIPAGGVWRMRTAGVSESVMSGYASIIAANGSPMPDATAMVRLSSNGNLVSETAVPAQHPLTQGLVFGSLEANRRTGLALVNSGIQDVSITLTPKDSDGNTVAPATTLVLGASEHVSKFLDELIGGLPMGFEGTVVLAAATPVYAISIRGTTNNSGFLMAMLPVTDLHQASSGPLYFPQVVDGGSFETRFLLVNPNAALPQVRLFGITEAQ